MERLYTFFDGKGLGIKVTLPNGQKGSIATIDPGRYKITPDCRELILVLGGAFFVYGEDGQDIGPYGRVGTLNHMSEKKVVIFEPGVEVEFEVIESKLMGDFIYRCAFEE